MKKRTYKLWSKGAALLLSAALLTGIAVPPPAEADPLQQTKKELESLFAEALTDMTEIPLVSSAAQLELVSESDEGQAGDSASPSVSEDGRFVAFDSESAGIVDGDNNGYRDVFLLDRETDTVTMISQTSYPTAPSYNPVISMDGSYVLFASESWNLVDDHVWAANVNLFLYDRQSEEMTMTAYGVSAGRNKYAISAGGRYIAFWSMNEYVNNDFNMNWDLYYKDLHTGWTKRITSLPYSEEETLETTLHSVTMTPDGRYVAFDAAQSDLVEGDMNQLSDVFVYDAFADSIERTSLSTSGAEANSGSDSPSISANGRFVAFASAASNLVEGGTSSGMDIYVRDRLSGELIQIPPPFGAGTVMKRTPAISADGRYVAYGASVDGQQHIYRYDGATGEALLLSSASDGSPGNRESMEPVSTHNGRYAAFVSRAANLSGVPEDDLDSDVFLADLGAGDMLMLPEWPNGASMQIEQVGGSYASLSWTPASGGSGPAMYEVTAIHNGARRVAAVTSDTSALITGLLASEAYTFEVSAGNNGYVFGESRLIAEAATQLPETAPPGKPSNVTVTPVPGKLLVTWTDPQDPDFAGVIVQSKKTSASLYWEQPLVLPGIQHAVIEGIANSQAYDVQLVAVDVEGNVSEATQTHAASAEGRVLERISVSGTGEQMTPKVYENEKPLPMAVDVSDDGRYFVFSGRAQGLIPDVSWDTPRQIYLYDRQTNAMQVISYDENGFLGNSDSWNPRISGDGRFVVFVSDAINLAGQIDATINGGIILYDRDSDGDGTFDEAGATSMNRISPYTYWSDPEQRVFADPSISADGTKILFRSLDNDFSEGSLYLFDRLKAETSGEPPWTNPLTNLALLPGDYTDPEISGNGQFAAVATTAALDAADTDGNSDIYVIRLSDLEGELISNLEEEVENADSGAMQPSVSYDGTKIVFAYTEEKQTGRYRVYMHDSETDTTRLIAESPLGSTEHPSISGSGAAVIYTGFSANGEASGNQVLVYDLASSEESIVSMSADGTFGNGLTYVTAIDWNGAVAAFVSSSDNLVSGDTNFTEDVFLVELASSMESDTEPPAWPEGAAASVSQVMHHSIMLTWPQASDQNGFVTYQIYRGNDLAATATASESGKTIGGLQAETAYTFTVIAVDGSGNRSAGLTVDAVTSKAPEEDDIVIFDATASAAVKYGSYAKIGDPLSISLRGSAGMQASALIRLLYSDGSLGEAQLALTEAEIGDYNGTYALEAGVAQVYGVEVHLSDGNRQVTQEAWMRSNIAVGGTALVEIADTLLEWLQDGTLRLTSADPRIKVQTAVKLDGSKSYELTGLPASLEGSAYKVAAITSTGEFFNMPDNLITIKRGETGRFAVAGMPQASLKGLLLAPGLSSESTSFMTAYVGTEMVYASQNAVVNGEVGFEIGGLNVGEEVTFKIYPKSAELDDRTVTTVIEAPGSNSFDIELMFREWSTLRGEVVNNEGEPLRGATVTGYQTIEGQSITKETLTDANGMYALELYEGAAQATAKYENETSAAAQVTMEIGEESQHDFLLQANAMPTIQLELYTKHIGEEWVGPINLNWMELNNYSIESTHSYRISSGDLFTFYAKSGETVELCVDGSKKLLPAACGTVVADDSDLKEIELRLEQRGAIVSGQIENHGAAEFATATIYKTDANGQLHWVREQKIDLIFDLHLNEPGQYQVVFTTTDTHFAVKNVEVSEGGLVNLGIIPLSESHAYGGEIADHLEVSQQEIVPGNWFLVSTQVNNHSEGSTEKTRLVVPLPSGTVLVAGSVVIFDHARGKFVPAPVRFINDYTFEADLGTMRRSQIELIRYGVMVPKDYDDSNFTSQVGYAEYIRYEQNGREITDLLGQPNLSVIRLRMNVPPTTGYRDFTIDGLATEGSIVKLYDGERLLGETSVRGTEGHWKIRIHLSDEQQSTHRLRAEAELGTKRWHTPVTTVTFDQDYPEISSFSMTQFNGATYRSDPRDGAASFPFVLTNKDENPQMRFMINFQNKDRVGNVRVNPGTYDSSATQSSDGSYQAVSGSRFFNKSVTVKYDIVGGEMEFDESIALEKQMRQLPEALKNIEQTNLEVQQTPEEPLRLVGKYNGKYRVMGDDVAMRAKVTYTPKDYEMTEKDEQFTTATGITMMGYSFHYAISERTLTYRIKGYIPVEDFIDLTGASKGVVSVAAINKKTIEAIYEGAIELATKHFDKYEYYDDIADTLENTGKLDELEKLLDRMEDSCSPGAASQYRERANEIADQYMTQEIVKWGMILGSLALAPATLGGTVLLFLATEQIEAVMDYIIDWQIKDLGKKISNDSACSKKKRVLEKKERIVAKPNWIHDPSGYVYEVEPNNRIEGVTATAVYWEESEQAWKLWDAEWFEQLNPYETDNEGKYGWNVPEGKWKVLYEKEGYEPAESWEMIVLPPHTDVNIAMESILPPKPLYAMAVSRGEAIDIVFDRHVDGETLSRLMLSVATEDEAGEPAEIEGEIAAVDPVEYKGLQVSKRFRFTPSAALNAGEEVSVRIYAGVQSYNGIPLTEESALQVQMEDLPPGEVSNVESIVTENGALLNWTNPSDLDLDRVEITWNLAGLEEYGEPVIVKKNAGFAIIDGWTPGSEYDVTITTVDAGGYRTEHAILATTPALEPEIDFAAPHQVLEAAGSAQGTALHVVWTDPADTEGLAKITVEWTKAGAADPAGSMDVEPGVQKADISGLEPNTEYDIAVRAWDESGNASIGVLLTARTGAASTGGGNGGTPGDGEGPGGGAPGGGTPPVQSDEAELVVMPEGGVLESFGGRLRLTIPQSTFPNRAELSVQVDESAQIPDGEGWRLLSPLYTIQERSGQSPQKPILLTITDDALDQVGVKRSSLGIYRLNPENPRDWTYIGGWISGSDSGVGAYTDELGTYAVLAYERMFADMRGHWSKAEVEALTSRHIVDGVMNNRFIPEQAVTRAEMVKMLLSAIPSYLKLQAAETDIRYKDVVAGSWYYDFVYESTRLGLIQGDQGLFRPNDPITREEMAVLTMRFTALLGKAADADEQLLERYKDRDEISAWAMEAMAFATEAGLMRGVQDDQIVPDGTTTRAQAATVIYRLLIFMEWV